MEQKREPLYDNIRAILIYLVLFGHLIAGRIGEDDIIREVYYIIYMFHMPAFVFLTGFLSKNTEKGRDAAFKNFLIPYLIFNTLYALMAYAVEGRLNEFTLSFKLFVPHYGMWFFLACYIWKVIAKDLDMTRFAIPVSILTGLFLPFLPSLNTSFTIGRVIGLLPFFVVGLKFKVEWIKMLRKIPAWVGAVVFILCAGISGWIGKTEWITLDVLYLKESYTDEMKMQEMLMRLVIYALGFLMTLALLNWTTRKRCFLTKIGANTLTVYVFHLYLMYFVKNTEYTEELLWWYVGGSVVVAAFFTWLLSRRIFAKLYQGIVGGVNRICFKE